MEFIEKHQKKIEERRREGAIAVDMEAAALAAVASFRNVSLGYILGAGDDISNYKWNHRNFSNSMTFHEKFFWLAAEIGTSLKD